MKKILLALLVLCMIQGVSAAELPVPGVDTANGIGVSGVKYNPDGSMGVGDIKYDKNGATGGSGLVVDKNNARAGNLVASGGMTPALTPLKNTPVSGSAAPASPKPSIGGSVSPTGGSGVVAGKVIVGNQLPKTGPEEILIIFIAGILSAAILYSTYRKNVL